MYMRPPWKVGTGYRSAPMVVPPGPLLAGKVAVVTGGGGGIGRGISLTFAAHGASVVVAEQDAARANETVAEIEAAGGTGSAVVVDVTDPAQVGELADAAGAVDVVAIHVGHQLVQPTGFRGTTHDGSRARYTR